MSRPGARLPLVVGVIVLVALVADRGPLGKDGSSAPQPAIKAGAGRGSQSHSGLRSPVEVIARARPHDLLGPGWSVVCSTSTGARSEWVVGGEEHIQLVDVPHGAVLTCVLHEPALAEDPPPVSARASLEVGGPGELVLNAGPSLETVVCVESPEMHLTFDPPSRVGPYALLEEGPPCWRVRSQHPQVLAVVSSPDLPCTRPVTVPRGGRWEVALDSEPASCPQQRHPQHIRVKCEDECPYDLRASKCTLDGPEPCAGGVCWSGACGRGDQEVRTLWIASDEGLQRHEVSARDPFVEISWLEERGFEVAARWPLQRDCQWRVFPPGPSPAGSNSLISGPCPTTGEIRIRLDGVKDTTLWLQVWGYDRYGTTAVGWVELPRDAPSGTLIDMGPIPLLPASRGSFSSTVSGWPPGASERWKHVSTHLILETDEDGSLWLFAAPFIQGRSIRFDSTLVHGEFTVEENFVLITDDGPILASDGVHVARLNPER